MCNSNTRWLREKHAQAKIVKEALQRKADPHNDAYLVSGSNPSSNAMLTDMEFTTQLSLRQEQVHLHEPKPKVIEPRRRSLKAEHCLQVTLDVSEYQSNRNDYDMTDDDRLNDVYMSGYDNGSASDADAGAGAGAGAISSSQPVPDAWLETRYKVFMENMAPNIAPEVLIKALRFCGVVNDVRFMRMDATETISTALGADNPQVLSSETLLEKFGIKADVRESKTAAVNEEKGVAKGFVMPKNPLAVLASVKRRIIKRKIATVSEKKEMKKL